MSPRKGCGSKGLLKAYRRGIRLEAFVEGLFEPFAMCGMCDTDQRLRPLLEVLPEQIYLPIFRHHPVHVSARGDDARAFRKGTIREMLGLM